LAVRDESTDDLLTIAYVGTGLDDETLESLTKRVKPIVLETKGKKVKIKPEIILEIGYSEIVISPEYESGFSLRFPVVKRIRDDLSLNDIDTLDRVKSMFKP
jgi:DNA ligase-1